MQRVYPNLTGLVDAKVENELNRFISTLYDNIDELEKKTGIASAPVRETSPSSTTTPPAELQRRQTSAGLVNGVFAQPVIGVGSDPNLKAAIPDDVLHSNMAVVAGAVPVGGYITIKDGFGNSVDVLTK